jgi:hypothetical protein
MIQQVFDVVARAGVEIIDAKNFLPFGKKRLT